MKRHFAFAWILTSLGTISHNAEAFDCLEKSPGFNANPKAYFSPTVYSATKDEAKTLEALFRQLSRSEWRGEVTETICLDKGNRINQGEVRLSFAERMASGWVLRQQFDYRTLGKTGSNSIEIADRRTLNLLKVTPSLVEVTDRFQSLGQYGGNTPVEQNTEIRLQGKMLDITVNFFTRGLLTGKSTFRVSRR